MGIHQRTIVFSLFNSVNYMNTIQNFVPTQVNLGETQFPTFSAVTSFRLCNESVLVTISSLCWNPPDRFLKNVIMHYIPLPHPPSNKLCERSKIYIIIETLQLPHHTWSSSEKTPRGDRDGLNFQMTQAQMSLSLYTGEHGDRIQR